MYHMIALPYGVHKARLLHSKTDGRTKSTFISCYGFGGVIRRESNANVFITFFHADTAYYVL